MSHRPERDWASLPGPDEPWHGAVSLGSGYQGRSAVISNSFDAEVDSVASQLFEVVDEAGCFPLQDVCSHFNLRFELLDIPGAVDRTLRFPVPDPSFVTEQLINLLKDFLSRTWPQGRILVASDSFRFPNQLSHERNLDNLPFVVYPEGAKQSKGAARLGSAEFVDAWQVHAAGLSSGFYFRYRAEYESCSLQISSLNEKLATPPVLVGAFVSQIYAQPVFRVWYLSRSEGFTDDLHAVGVQLTESSGRSRPKSLIKVSSYGLTDDGQMTPSRYRSADWKPCKLSRSISVCQFIGPPVHSLLLAPPTIPSNVPLEAVSLDDPKIISLPITWIATIGQRIQE